MDNVKPSGELERKLAEFSDEQMRTISQNTFAIQLTEGCSNGCPDCGLGAKKGVRDYISFNFLKKLFKDYGFKLKLYEPLLYFASDPFDYDFDGTNYLGVHHMVQGYGYNPSVLTSIPRGKEELIFAQLLEDAEKDFDEKLIKGISLTQFNYKRVEHAFYNSPNREIKKWGKFFDSFLKILKYHAFEVKEFYPGGNSLRLNLGDKNKDDLSKVGINCYHGVLITPKGVFNCRTITPTREFPYGINLTPITQAKFKTTRIIRRFLVEDYADFVARGEC